MRADLEFRRCLADDDLMAGLYGALAADYDWLFDGDESVAPLRKLHLCLPPARKVRRSAGPGRLSLSGIDDAWWR